LKILGDFGGQACYSFRTWVKSSKFNYRGSLPMRIRAVAPATAAFLILFMVHFAASAATPKACDLLSAQTASSLLGGPVNLPVDMSGIGCSYMTKSGSAVVGLIVTDAQGMTADNFKMIQTAGAASHAAVEQIPGLGEVSYLVGGGADRNVLAVLYHQKTLALSVQRKMTPDLKTAIIQAMKQILAKI
jgi:hypothetical protein